MAADFSKPTTNSTKLGFPQEIVDNDQELAVMHDGGGASSNKPTNTKRIDNSTGEVFNWNGSSWVSIGFISLTRDPVGDITDGAPTALDTLNELAAAIADDENFAASVTASLDGKLAKASNLSDLTNTATARTNLDVYSKSESDNLTATSVARYYVHPTGTGNGSGSDANNRMSETNFRNEFANFNTAIVNVADNTTYTDILVPTAGTDTDPGRITSGKTIMLEIGLSFQGNTTTFTTLRIRDGMKVYLYCDGGNSGIVNIGHLSMDGHSYLGGKLTDNADSYYLDKISVSSMGNIGIQGPATIYMPYTDFEYTSTSHHAHFRGDVTFRSYTQTSQSTYGTVITEGSNFRLSYKSGTAVTSFSTNGTLWVCYGSNFISSDNVTCEDIFVTDRSSLNCGYLTVNNPSGTNVKRMSNVSVFSSSSLTVASDSLLTTGLIFGTGTERPLILPQA